MRSTGKQSSIIFDYDVEQRNRSVFGLFIVKCKFKSLIFANLRAVTLINHTLKKRKNSNSTLLLPNF